MNGLHSAFRCAPYLVFTNCLRSLLPVGQWSNVLSSAKGFDTTQITANWDNFYRSDHPSFSNCQFRAAALYSAEWQVAFRWFTFGLIYCRNSEFMMLNGVINMSIIDYFDLTASHPFVSILCPAWSTILSSCSFLDLLDNSVTVFCYIDMGYCSSLWACCSSIWIDPISGVSHCIIKQVQPNMVWLSVYIFAWNISSL